MIPWVAVHEASDVSGSPRVIIGGIYPAPGGDAETWAQVIKEFQILEARYHWFQLSLLVTPTFI